MTRKKKTSVVEKETTLPCCDCSGTVSFVHPDNSKSGGQPTFFHTMPYCKRFDDTNTTDAIIQYMRDCANKIKN